MLEANRDVEDCFLIDTESYFNALFYIQHISSILHNRPKVVIIEEWTIIPAISRYLMHVCDRSFKFQEVSLTIDPNRASHRSIVKMRSNDADKYSIKNSQISEMLEPDPSKPKYSSVFVLKKAIKRSGEFRMDGDAIMADLVRVKAVQAKSGRQLEKIKSQLEHFAYVINHDPHKDDAVPLFPEDSVDRFKQNLLSVHVNNFYRKYPTTHTWKNPQK